MNKKINDFNKDWYQYRQSSFSTILRSIVDAFYENVYQYKDVFREIIGFDLPENPPLKSKKSVILDSPLIPMNNELKRMNSIRKSPNFGNSDTIIEREEKSDTNSNENSKKLARKPTSIFYEAKDRCVCDFKEDLKGLKINMEDEHLMDLDEAEILLLFKRVMVEMNKKFEEYKTKLNDSIKFYKEIKEVYLEELIKGKENYMSTLGDLLQNKFTKIFTKKKGNYLKLFEIIVMKLRTYSEKFKDYLDVERDIIFPNFAIIFIGSS